MFIATLPMRVRFSADEQLSPWLITLHRRRLQALERERDPLTRIARWTGRTGPNDLFDSIVVVENFPSAAALRPPEGLQIERVSSTIDEGYPLVLEVSGLSADGDGTAALVLRSDPKRFTVEDRDRLLTAVTTFIAVLAEQSAVPPGDAKTTMGDLLHRVDRAVRDRAAARRTEVHAAGGRTLRAGVREPVRREEP